MPQRSLSAIVTGSSRGIGRAIALRLAESGYDIVVDYVRNKDAATEVAAEIRAKGRRAEVVQADVSTTESCRALVASAVRAFGQVSVLVNNAGTESSAPFWQVKEADFDRLLAVNLKSCFFMTQAFVRQALSARDIDPDTLTAEAAMQGVGDDRGPAVIGRVINISSVHEDLPFPNFAPYCVSKGGMRMLTRTLAVELGPLGITVNAIAPGAIKTAINTNLLGDQQKLGALLGKIPLRRLGEASEVAGVAAFLASSDADYVTGSTYFIDGGLSVDYYEQ